MQLAGVGVWWRSGVLSPGCTRTQWSIPWAAKPPHAAAAAAAAAYLQPLSPSLLTLNEAHGIPLALTVLSSRP